MTPQQDTELTALLNQYSESHPCPDCKTSIIVWSSRDDDKFFSLPSPCCDKYKKTLDFELSKIRDEFRKANNL